MFGVTRDVAAFCGRSAVHVIPMTIPPRIGTTSLNLVANMPVKSKANPKDVFSVGLDLSEGGEKIAVFDSVKNVYLFEHSSVSKKWSRHSAWVMDKRVVRVKIDREENFVVMIDKTGDVYLCFIGPKGVSLAQKIMGHTSLITDVALTQNNLCIITCDRDEKIRISSFPMAFQVLGYALGHRSSVMNVALLKNDQFMVSASIDGDIRIWRFGTNGAKDHTLMFNFNVMDFLGLTAQISSHEPNPYELARMKAADHDGRIFVAVLVSGFSEVTIFEVLENEQSLLLVLQERLEHDVVDITFAWDTFYVHCPEIGVFRKYVLQPGFHFSRDDTFKMIFHTHALQDIASFGTSYRPNMAPLMKRYVLPPPKYPASPPPQTPPPSPPPLFPHAAPTVAPELALASEEEMQVLMASNEFAVRLRLNDVSPIPGEDQERMFLTPIGEPISSTSLQSEEGDLNATTAEEGAAAAAAAAGEEEEKAVAAAAEEEVGGAAAAAEEEPNGSRDLPSPPQC